MFMIFPGFGVSASEFQVPQTLAEAFGAYRSRRSGAWKGAFSPAETDRFRCSLLLLRFRPSTPSSEHYGWWSEPTNPLQDRSEQPTRDGHLRHLEDHVLANIAHIQITRSWTMTLRTHKLKIPFAATHKVSPFPDLSDP